MACPFGWQSAPPGVEYSARCYKSVSWATSLRECVENCGLGAAPVCPKSAEEAALVTGIFTDEAMMTAYLGLYRNSSGSFECVSGGAAQYTKWVAASPTFRGEPDNWHGIEHCIIIGSTTEWHDYGCGSMGQFSSGCICGSPLNVSTAYISDVARLEASAEEC